jgi:hypothetical protein
LQLQGLRDRLRQGATGGLLLELLMPTLNGSLVVALGENTLAGHVSSIA